jgi:hypothetical protein
MLDINISENGSTLTYTDATGNKQVKAIDLTDLVKVLSKDVSFDMGFLPIGTRYLGIRGDQIHVAMERPAGVYDVSFATGSNVEVVGKAHLPAALFLFVLTKANDAYFVGNSYIFAMRQDNIMLGIDGLYQYPTPNVFPDARICWGQNEEAIKNFKSLAALNGVVRRFFTAPFNHDLFNTGHLSSKFPWSKVARADGEGNSAKSYLKFLTENAFEGEWLVPQRESLRNFDSVIKAIFKPGV